MGLYWNNHNLSNTKAELQELFSWVILEKEGTELSTLMLKKNPN